MREFKEGDVVERRLITQYEGDVWKRVLYSFTDENGNHAITYANGTREMLPRGTQDLR